LSTAGHSPLPEYQPPAEGPAGYFRLLYGRSPVHTFARTQNTPALHELQPENEVWVNDAVAARLGLKAGDRVWLENQDGAKSGPIAVKATPRIRPDCVYMVHGFGHDAPGMTRAHGKGASDATLQTRYVLDRSAWGHAVNFVKLVREADMVVRYAISIDLDRYRVPACAVVRQTGNELQ
jgi:thiosulfate reductase/polysulfide reductase chain A